MNKSSYQILKEKNQKLKSELNQANEYERMMKDLINAINLKQESQIESISRWFEKHSKCYHKDNEGRLI